MSVLRIVTILATTILISIGAMAQEYAEKRDVYAESKVLIYGVDGDIMGYYLYTEVENNTARLYNINGDFIEVIHINDSKRELNIREHHKSGMPVLPKKSLELEEKVM